MDGAKRIVARFRTVQLSDIQPHAACQRICNVMGQTRIVISMITALLLVLWPMRTPNEWPAGMGLVMRSMPACASCCNSACEYVKCCIDCCVPTMPYNGLFKLDCSGDKLDKRPATKPCGEISRVSPFTVSLK